MTSAMPQMKASTTIRVDVGKSINNASAARNARSELCPAGAHNLRVDIYGRPVGAQYNNAPVQTADCAIHSDVPTSRMLEIESSQRPTVVFAEPGMRGGADFMGVGRNLIPRNLYGVDNVNTPSFASVYVSNSMQLPRRHENLEAPSPDQYNLYPAWEGSLDSTRAARFMN